MCQGTGFVWREAFRKQHSHSYGFCGTRVNIFVPGLEQSRPAPFGFPASPSTSAHPLQESLAAFSGLPPPRAPQLPVNQCSEQVQSMRVLETPPSTVQLQSSLCSSPASLAQPGNTEVNHLMESLEIVLLDTHGMYVWPYGES